MNRFFHLPLPRSRGSFFVTRRWRSNTRKASCNLDASGIGELLQLLANVRRYTDPEELTAEMLNHLVDEILIYASDKSSEHRKQKIEIYYNAVGVIDLPTAKKDDCVVLHGRIFEQEYSKKGNRYY